MSHQEETLVKSKSTAKTDEEVVNLVLHRCRDLSRSFKILLLDSKTYTLLRKHARDRMQVVDNFGTDGSGGWVGNFLGIGLMAIEFEGGEKILIGTNLDINSRGRSIGAKNIGPDWEFVDFVVGFLPP